ncbi:MAG: hypothetical protein K2X66_04520 [Cyanobacteria bacterium]|nr:hypothetical protein [Cyanobacteriota bacterium]
MIQGFTTPGGYSSYTGFPFAGVNPVPSFSPINLAPPFYGPSVYAQSSTSLGAVGIRAFSPEIQKALTLLGQIQNLPGDEQYLQQMGVNIVFRNGQQALEVIRQKNIRVEFGDMGDSLAHAQWILDENLIMINQKYKGDSSKASLYAISEAIYHEAGHAALRGDDRSSLQEEIDCLALNTLAYKYHIYSDPAYAQVASTSRLIKDGVALYAKLFFDPDLDKKALVNRIIEKYGILPPETPDHPIPRIPFQIPLADRVMRQLHRTNTGG